MLKTYLEDVLFQKAALVSLLHIDERDLVKIHVVGAGVEVGERMKRTHCHFNLYITHTTKILLSKGTQRRWQNFVQMTLPVYTPNVYVNIILLDTRRENYALKNQYVLND
jgi:hypothetical protein